MPADRRAAAPPYPRLRDAGFSLAELAVVLVIVALLTGGLVVSLGAQRELQQIQETRAILATAREALLGFAAVNGRLPCPAAPPASPPLSTDRGTESPPGGGACTNPYNGFLPAADLGISPADPQGFALDGWNQRIRYAITTSDSNAFTTANGIKTAWPSLSPDIQVCATVTGKTDLAPSSNCATTARLVSLPGAVGVAFSTGKNAVGVIGIPSDPDELQNWQATPDRLFVSQTQTNTFDDIMLWISPHILYSRLLSAGRLP